MMEVRILYDGECPLCQGAVRWIRERDPAGRITFAPLQDNPACGLDSVVLQQSGRQYRESSAVLRAARYLIREMYGFIARSGDIARALDEG